MQNNDHPFEEDYEEYLPEPRSRKEKGLRVILGIGLLAFLYAGSTTLAANISLGSGNTEFGQGVLTSTACDDQILITPKASFNNTATPSPVPTPSNVTGVFYLGSIEVTGVDSSAGKCDGKWFTFKAFNGSSSSPLALVDGAMSFSVLDTAGTFSSTQSGISVVTNSSSSFTLTFTTPIATSKDVARVTLESSDAAPTQLVVSYAVGDSGPGGGIIYYVDANGFNCGSAFSSTGSPTGGLCHYLEVALNTWDGDATSPVDPRRQIITNAGPQSTDNTGITNDATAYNNAASIGLGYKNTLALVTAENNVANAAGTIRAYAGGGKTDWYLPTTTELNLLCQWARGVTQDPSTICTGGNDNRIWDVAAGVTTGASNPVSFEKNRAYWSSSESGPFQWVQYFGSGGNQDPRARGDNNNIRPIRAF